jgi:riboflavin kinase/FMN adenylyltransferase
LGRFSHEFCRKAQQLFPVTGEKAVPVEVELARFSPESDTLLTIGVFDGVHLGHKYLISKLLAEAGQNGWLAGVVTFHQHPEELLSPRAKLLFLTGVEERIDLLRDEGINLIIPISFTAEVARLSARQFVTLLQKYLRMRGLVVGSDFALGRGREGDTDNLKKLGQAMNFSVTVVPPLVINNEVVSSTAIRQAMAAGDMNKVHQFMGRPFSLQGRVVTGAGRGTGLGFPTANMDISAERALPPDGVYASWAHINGKAYPSMVNVGKCPTFDGGERTVEAYLVDYQGDLYGRELKIDIIARLRDEKKFSNAEELKAQVAEDIRQGRMLLDAAGGS